MDTLRIRSMLRSPTGPVGRKVIERGELIAERAWQLAAPHGTMNQHIRSYLMPTLLGTTVYVSSEHPASIFVLKGTKPHDIPFKKPQALNFVKVGWRTVTVVHHPGYKGDDFLKRAMEEAGRL